MLYRISTGLSHLFFKIFFSLKVEGQSCIPAQGSFILASNHLSNLDPPLLASICPRKVAFAAKKELFKNKLIAFYFRAVGSIPIDRRKISIQAVKSLVKTLETRPLLIFPQGSRGAGLKDAYAGAGFLYKKAKVPVIAAKISGTDKILPPGRILPRMARIKVVFKPVSGLNPAVGHKQITAKIINTIFN